MGPQEHPDEVNRQLRALAESVRGEAPDQLVAVADSTPSTSAAARCPDRTAPSRNPVHSSAVSVPAQKMPSTGLRSQCPYLVHDPGGTAAVGPPGANSSAPQRWST